MPKKFKFPPPGKCTFDDPVLICPAERVIKLYNQEVRKDAKKISMKVRKWFTAEAHKRGWAAVRFVKEVQSGHGGGCILWISPRQLNVTVVVTARTLVLVESDS